MQCYNFPKFQIFFLIFKKYIPEGYGISSYLLWQALSKLAVQCNNSNWCGLNLAPDKVQQDTFQLTLLHFSLKYLFIFPPNICPIFTHYLSNLCSIFRQNLSNICATGSVAAYFSIHSGSPPTQFVVLTRVLPKLLTRICMLATFVVRNLIRMCSAPYLCINFSSPKRPLCGADLKPQMHKTEDVICHPGFVIDLGQIFPTLFEIQEFLFQS